MKLYIGGRNQGKCNYVLQKEGNLSVTEGDFCEEADVYSAEILNHFHLFVRKMLIEEKEMNKFVQNLFSKNPKIVIISNELGCGIVPMDAFERRWREETGRICCQIAEYAESVERILCGIGQKIK